MHILSSLKPSIARSADLFDLSWGMVLVHVHISSDLKSLELAG